MVHTVRQLTALVDVTLAVPANPQVQQLASFNPRHALDSRSHALSIQSRVTPPATVESCDCPHAPAESLICRLLSRRTSNKVRARSCFNWPHLRTPSLSQQLVIPPPPLLPTFASQSTTMSRPDSRQSNNAPRDIPPEKRRELWIERITCAPFCFRSDAAH